MQTGTLSASLDDFTPYKKYTFTLALLCIGYFIDFYDLTIWSASYTNIIRDSFNIYDIHKSQKLYLMISNYYTAGIVLGGVLFGVLGDKLGRIKMIRYSILLYSLATIGSVFAHSVAVFTALRFLAGAGLSIEFSTSSILISEALPPKYAARFTTWLYFCGILGGITATYLGSVSWHLMFLFGGISGLVLYIIRKNLLESELFLNLTDNVVKGSLLQLVATWANVFKLLRLWMLLVPFYFLISIIFIFPGFMQLHGDIASQVHVLLAGFFIGNLISTLGSNFIVNKLKDYRVFLLLNSVLFIVAMSAFSLVNDKWFFPYSIIIGLLGGGLPTVWMQVAAKSYGVNLRSTATGMIGGIGRFSCIGVNLLASYWLMVPKTFVSNCIISIIIIGVISIIALLNTSNNYATDPNFVE